MLFTKCDDNHIEGDEWQTKDRWEVNIKCQKCRRKALMWEHSTEDVKEIGHESVNWI